MTARRRIGRGLLLALLLRSGPAQAQPADTVLLHGQVVRFDAPPAEALAVRGTTILAVGSSAEMRARIGPRTRVIDLGGRSVIPGLVDSHIHAIRAGLAWNTEVSWIGARSLAEALDRLRERARTTPPEGWLVVAGGWVPEQFSEGRLPTLAEVTAAAPRHRVFVQQLYTRILLGPGAAAALGLTAGDPLAARLRPESAGNGWLRGEPRAIADAYARLPQPGEAEQIAGTRGFFRELNRLGVTGVLDPGGYNLPVDAYQTLFQLWRAGGLTLRVRYSLCSPRRGTELADFQALTALLPADFGDDWLRFIGIGENVTWGMYDNDSPTAADQAQLAAVLRWAAAQRLGATFHWTSDLSAHRLLEVLEQVAAETPLRPLRWSIAHLHDASRATLARMQALGVGWLLQDAFYFRGGAFLAQRGTAALGQGLPPLVAALEMGVPMAAGTDAHRVMSYNPFVALQWLLDGRTVTGLPMRGASELPSRLQALRLYTEAGAWFAFEEARRGALVPGRLADLAVLSGDYLAAPVETISDITSVLTMVGGQVVYASGPYAALAGELAREFRPAR